MASAACVHDTRAASPGQGRVHGASDGRDDLVGDWRAAHLDDAGQDLLRACRPAEQAWPTCRLVGRGRTKVGRQVDVTVNEARCYVAAAGVDRPPRLLDVRHVSGLTHSGDLITHHNHGVRGCDAGRRVQVEDRPPETGRSHGRLDLPPFRPPLARPAVS